MPVIAVVGMEFEGILTAPNTVRPFLAVIKFVAVIFPPKEASPAKNKRLLAERSPLNKIRPPKDASLPETKSPATADKGPVKVAPVVSAPLKERPFTVTPVKLSIEPLFMVRFLPILKFPFIDKSPETKSFPFKELSAITARESAFIVEVVDIVVP